MEEHSAAADVAPTGDDLLRVLAALANPQRLRILATLAGGRMYVSKLARELRLGRPLVHLHLSRLEGAGLVTGSLELSADGKAMKWFEVVPFALQLTPQQLARAVESLTIEQPPAVRRRQGAAGPVGRRGSGDLRLRTHSHARAALPELRRPQLDPQPRAGRRHRPRLVRLSPAAVLAVLAMGQLGATVGLPQDKAFRGEPEFVVGLQALQQHFPSDAGNPAVIIARASSQAAVVAAAGQAPGVGAVRPTGNNGELVRLTAPIDADPGSTRERDVITGLRERVRAVAGGDAVVGDIFLITRVREETLRSGTRAG